MQWFTKSNARVIRRTKLRFRKEAETQSSRIRMGNYTLSPKVSTFGAHGKNWPPWKARLPPRIDRHSAYKTLKTTVASEKKPLQHQPSLEDLSAAGAGEQAGSSSQLDGSFNASLLIYRMCCLLRISLL